VSDPSPSPAADRSEPTRVAVLGAGFIADFHLEILADTSGVEVVAVCDRDAHRAESAARRFGVPRAVGSIAELAELGVDVVHVLAPPDLHGRLVRECLEAGLGVLAEKPLVLASAEAEELGRLAAERGLPLGANHNALHHPAFASVLEAVRAGRIGRVEHVQVTLSVPLRQLDAGDTSHWMFREPRNIVYEQAVHPFSQLAELVGGVEHAHTTLLGTRELQPGQVFHDRWLVAARAERGTAEVYLAFGQPFTRHTLQVLGTDGSLEADLFHDHVAGETKTPWLDFWNSYLAGRRRAKGYRRSANRVLRHYLRQTLGLGPREDAFFAGMRGSIRAFHAALRAGSPPPVDAASAARVLRWCEAAVAELPSAAAPASGAAERWQPPEPGEPRSGEVVVLGATGFIGKRTVARLLAEGRPVTAVVRRTHSLPGVLVEGADSGQLRLVRGSLEDADALARALRGADVVLHLATGGGARWEDFERSMVGGTRAVARAAHEAGARRLVFVSSTAALYLGRDGGAAEIADGGGPDPRPEARPLYARGKIAAEHALTELARETGLAVTIVRPGIVLGEGTPMQHSGLGLWVRDNHCVGWGPGTHPLPVVWVDDVADALCRLAAYPGTDLDGQALNLCSRAPLSARELVDELRRTSGRDLHFHPRSLWLSQAMEIGKWIVKRAGGRRDAPFPSWRDLKSRAMVPPVLADLARERLGWKPVEDREGFLDAAIRGRRAGEGAEQATG